MSKPNVYGVSVLTFFVSDNCDLDSLAKEAKLAIDNEFSYNMSTIEVVFEIPENSNAKDILDYSAKLNERIVNPYEVIPWGAEEDLTVTELVSTNYATPEAPEYMYAHGIRYRKDPE